MLLVNLGDVIHKEVKVRAAANGLTIRQWIVQAVLLKIRSEKACE